MALHAPGIYSRHLDGIADHLFAMGEKVQQAMILSGRALEQHDESLRHEARALDKEINALADELEHQVIHLFQRNAPMASDLRYVMAMLKAAISLERAGDLAKNTTKHMARLKVPFRDGVLDALKALVGVNQRMLGEVLDSVRDRDPAKAARAWRMDDEADEACDRVFAAVREEMGESPAVAGQLADILFAAKNYERMADYCADIAKMVIYVVTGTRPHKDDLRAM